MRWWCGLVVPILVLGALGCGDGLRRVSVRGRVTAGGAPLARATIQFLPAEGTRGEGGIGTSDSEGNFTLIGSRAGARGVVPGRYRVRVSRTVDRDGTLLPPDARQADHPGAREAVPAPYSSLASPLEVSVPEQGGEVHVEIPVPVGGKEK
jgi:hypothetical protein